MIRQNLQLKNNKVSVNLFHKIKTKLWLYLTDSAHTLHTMGFEDADARFWNTLLYTLRAVNVSPDSIAMFSSFPERNTLQRPESLI